MESFTITAWFIVTEKSFMNILIESNLKSEWHFEIIIWNVISFIRSHLVEIISKEASWSHTEKNNLSIN